MNEAGQQIARGARDYQGAYATETAPQPMAPVLNAMRSLIDLHAALHDRIGVVTQRLEAVLAPTPPTPVGAESNKLARHSMAQQIEAECASVQGAIARLESIINRLEL